MLRVINHVRRHAKLYYTLCELTLIPTHTQYKVHYARLNVAPLRARSLLFQSEFTSKKLTEYPDRFFGVPLIKFSVNFVIFGDLKNLLNYNCPNRFKVRNALGWKLNLQSN